METAEPRWDGDREQREPDRAGLGWKREKNKAQAYFRLQNAR